MMSDGRFLAIDLGASSGRAVLGTLGDGRVAIEVIHRFPNEPLRRDDGLFWDFSRLWEETKGALQICARRGITLDGVGVDTWGVDYGLLDGRGELIGLPYHYRDARTVGAPARVFERIPRDRVYAGTGIQFMPLNTIYQLFAEVTGPQRRLARAERLLFMPDLMNHQLCGSMTSERSIASTSQLYDFAPPQREGWSPELVRAIGLPEAILPRVCPSGSVLGPLRDDVAGEVGLRTQVIAPCGHDTGCAVAAVPARGENWAYISSGTWSLVGVELRQSVRSEAALAASMTNEAGVDGTIRFLRNVAGLWLLQECKRTWESADSGPLKHEQLVAEAEAAPPLGVLVDPDDPRFAAPGDMPARIVAFCQETGQRPPLNRAAITRCILESLALKYRHVLEDIARVARRPIDVVHVVGGGVQNVLLCQFTADAIGKPVIAGPVEATAIGNCLIQALAMGRIDSLAGLRQVVFSSVQPTRYAPQAGTAWQRAYGRFLELLIR